MTEHAKLVKLVERALAADYVVSVIDYESVLVKRSADATQIIEAAESVGECTLLFRTKDFHIRGWISLVFGNAYDGSELIDDHSGNLEMIKLCAE